MFGQVEKPPKPGRPVAVPNTGNSLPIAPAWFTPAQAELFDSIVSDLAAAKVPLKRVDRHAIMMTVECLDGVRAASTLMNDASVDPAVRAQAMQVQQKLSRDLIQWLPLICGTPTARARVGIKAEPERKPGPFAQLLAQRIAQGG